jgi:2-polyprenyl-6-methoxyphenol hydroxylase-like FAD-dependent oxidoreductase
MIVTGSSRSIIFEHLHYRESLITLISKQALQELLIKQMNNLKNISLNQSSSLADISRDNEHTKVKRSILFIYLGLSSSSIQLHIRSIKALSIIRIG